MANNLATIKIYILDDPLLFFTALQQSIKGKIPDPFIVDFLQVTYCLMQFTWLSASTWSVSCHLIHCSVSYCRVVDKTHGRDA